MLNREFHLLHYFLFSIFYKNAILTFIKSKNENF